MIKELTQEEIKKAEDEISQEVSQLPQEAKDQLAAMGETKQEMVTVPKRELTAPEMQKMAMDLFNPEGKMPEIDQLPKIKIVHEVQMFQLPGGTVSKEVCGCIIEAYICRNFWGEETEENKNEKKPPICYSPDGRSPSPLSEKIQCEGGVPQNGCINCALNKYGTDLKGGKGKACKETRKLFLLVGDYNLPLQLNCASKSLSAFSEYSTEMYGAGWPYQAGNVKLTLEKATRGKEVYSVLKISCVDIEQDILVMKQRAAIAKKFMDIMHRQEITTEDTE